MSAALSRIRTWSVCGVAAVAVCIVAVTLSAADKPAKSADEFRVPKGLAPIEYPKDNPMTAAKVQLGRQLFFDPRLSNDNTVSCATCHDPAKGWSNGEAFATGVGGQKGGRSAPTIVNATYHMFQFWDGRAGTLEEQALGPIQNPIEMSLTLEELVKKLNAIPGYKKEFKDVFGTDVTAENIARAIAAYERTILSGDAPYDKYKEGDKKAMSAAAVRGMDLFFGKAHCSACHTGPNFTDNAFHNIGVDINAKEVDHGRRTISKMEGDHGSFKTPSLRDIAATAPYMHNGSEKTLADVVAYYNKGGTPNDYLDEELFPLNLTKEEQADLVQFLKEGLTSTAPPTDKAPKLPE